MEGTSSRFATCPHPRGVSRATGQTIGASLVGVFGVGLIVPGTFRPDALRNHPPDVAGEVTLRGQIHNASGPLMFVSLFAACLVLAGSFGGLWRTYTVSTAVVGFALTASTAVSFRRDAAKTGVVQRLLIVVHWRGSSSSASIWSRLSGRAAPGFAAGAGLRSSRPGCGRCSREMPSPITPPPRQRSSIESFLDDYQAVRLHVNAAALVVVIAALVGDWAPADGLVAPRVAILSVIIVHAAWCAVRRVRAPISMLVLDVTLLGGLMLTLPGYTSVMTGIFGFLALVVVLFTERSRAYFLVYLTAWYSLAFLNGGVISSERVADLFGSVFAVGAIVAVMIRVRMWLGQLDANRSQTIGTVSHELRNSLTGVLGLTQLAAESSDANPETRELVLAANRQAVDASEIVEDLLTASRVEAAALRVTLRPVDVNDEASTVARRFHGVDREIQLHLADDLPLALADALRVRQAIRNLVSNAVRYGGPNIAIITEVAGGAVELIVRDNGDGVPVDEETSIFLPYRRSTRGRQDPNSIGLGLWICRHLARAMGGELEYRRNGGFTEFVLTLPVDPGHASAGTVIWASGAQPTG